MNFQRNCQQQLVILLRCTFGNKVPEFVRFWNFWSITQPRTSLSWQMGNATTLWGCWAQIKPITLQPGVQPLSLLQPKTSDSITPFAYNQSFPTWHIIVQYVWTMHHHKINKFVCLGVSWFDYSVQWPWTNIHWKKSYCSLVLHQQLQIWGWLLVSISAAGKVQISVSWEVALWPGQKAAEVCEMLDRHDL